MRYSQLKVLLPIAGFAFGCVFYTLLGILLLAVIPWLRLTVSGLLAFVIGAFVGGVGVGNLTVGFFSRPNGDATTTLGFFVQLAIAIGSAVGGGLSLAWILQRRWSKKNGVAAPGSRLDSGPS